MKPKRLKHSVRCLRSIETYVGGRDRLSRALGVSYSTVAKWVRTGKISGQHVLKLIELSGDRFTATELLGGKDK